MRWESAEVRLANKTVLAANGCQEFTGAHTAAGYGKIFANGRHYYAHRLSYELRVGEIPAGQVVCHHCDNPRCVKPEHLFAGTQQENVRDAIAKGRVSRAQKPRASNPFCRRGHDKRGLRSCSKCHGDARALRRAKRAA